MGASCTTLDVASEREVKAAAKAIRDWEKAQKGDQRVAQVLNAIRMDSFMRLANECHHAGSVVERLGGPGRVLNIVQAFYRKLSADAEMRPYFERLSVQRMRSNQLKIMQCLLGGTASSAADVRCTKVETATEFGLDIGRFRILADLLRGTLDELGVARDVIDEILANLEASQASIIQDLGLSSEQVVVATKAAPPLPHGVHVKGATTPAQVLASRLPPVPAPSTPKRSAPAPTCCPVSPLRSGCNTGARSFGGPAAASATASPPMAAAQPLVPVSVVSLRRHLPRQASAGAAAAVNLRNPIATDRQASAPIPVPTLVLHTNTQDASSAAASAAASAAGVVVLAATELLPPQPPTPTQAPELLRSRIAPRRRPTALRPSMDSALGHGGSAPPSPPTSQHRTHCPVLSLPLPPSAPTALSSPVHLTAPAAVSGGAVRGGSADSAAATGAPERAGSEWDGHRLPGPGGLADEDEALLDWILGASGTPRNLPERA